MQRVKSILLTDASNNIWLDDFSVSSTAFAHAGPRWSIRKRTLKGGRRDGVDLIELDNGVLAVSILPTRGMGLWHGHFNGLHLGWKSPVRGPVHPKYVETSDRGGIGWLTGFDEWLVRCGLAWNGPPGEDTYTDTKGRSRKDLLSLHGRIANQPAHHVEVRIGLEAPHELSVVGVVEETGLFYPHLELTTTYTTVPGSNRLMIHDRVVNKGAEPGELQMLYHCNLGPPFLEAGSRIVAPIREVCPLTPRAAEGIDTLETYAGPQAGFAEQVYAYDLLAGADDKTMAMIYSAKADRGMTLRFSKKELPCFTVWKNTAAIEDGYVTGLEPATNYPNFKGYERQQGRVVPLPPGGAWDATWSIEVHDTAQGVTNSLKEVAMLQAQGKATIHRQPKAKYSSQGK